MPMNSQKRENVQTTILALLLARKRGCTLNQLVKDYYETEGDSIPWKELGYSSLLNFLHSMSKSVEIEVINNTCFVKGIASDKSKHISKLVSGQKEYKCLVGRKSHRSSHYYPNTATQRIHIPAEILTMVISLVNNYPDGVNKDYIFEKVQSCMPFVKISMSDMEEQLQNLSHKIYQSNNKIFPVQSKSRNLHSKSPIIIIGGEDTNDMLDFEEENDFQFVPSVCASQSCCIKSPTKTKPTSYFIEETVSKCQDQVSENEVTECTSQIDTDQNILCETQNYNCDNIEFNNDLEEGNYFYGKNVDILINERVKFRLEKLIQSHPDGIWCADLPEKYLQEYKVSLNYTELGFNSVREFASQLPEIFYCIQPNDTGDFMLYYAKGEVLLNTPKEKQKTTNLMELHRIYATDDEVEALPTTLSLDTCKKLIPDGIVTIGECVGHLNVTDLMNDVKPYVEVVVVEVFTPSFFWIQLRKKQKAFKTFMDDLHEFYTKRYEEYVIPLIVLEKGLNCACIYNGIWHRAIIKTVKPDLQVTVMFYDYGTLKTYPPDSVYYLDRMFSSLPAQAIPCGLVNTKPYKAFKWSRSTTHQFAIRTSQIPLIATIASVNTEDNSMMITLTDTLEEEDVHINDWLVEQKLAEHGKMGDKVDMSNLLLYVEENLIFSPEQCYEEEISVSKSEEKNLEEKFVSMPLISPQSTLSDRTPIFSKLPNESEKLSTITENHLQDQSLKNDLISSGFSLTNANTNPFLQDEFMCIQDEDELTPEKFMELWNENLKIQMQITATFHLLFNKVMKNSKKNVADIPIKNENIRKVLNNIYLQTDKDMLISNFASTNTLNAYPVTTSSVANSYNDMKSIVTNSDFMNFLYTTDDSVFPATNQRSLYTFPYNGNVNSCNNVDFIENADIRNSIRNSNSVYPTGNWFVPANSSVNATDQFLANERLATNESFPLEIDKLNMQLNLDLSTSPEKLVNNERPLREETNPFRLNLAGKLEVTNTDEKKCFNSNLVSCSRTNQELVTEYETKTFEKDINIESPDKDILKNLYKETLNSYRHIFSDSSSDVNNVNNDLSTLRAKSHIANHASDIHNIASNIESVLHFQSNNSEVTTHVQYPETNSQKHIREEKQKENLVFNSSSFPLTKSFVDRNTQSAMKSDERKKVYRNDAFNFSQSPSTHSNVVTVSEEISNNKHVNKNCASTWLPINNFTSSGSVDNINIDEGYLTRPSTSHTSYRSSPLMQMNTDIEYDQQSLSRNSNELCGTQTKMWMKSIEETVTAQSENLDKMCPLFEENERNVEISLYDENRQQSSMESTAIKNTKESRINGDNAIVNNICTIESESKDAGCMENKYSLSNSSSPSTKIFVQPIELSKCTLHVFHHQGEGWLLVDEFVKAFTKFETTSYMMNLLHMINVHVPIKEIDKTQYSIEVLELNYIPLETTQNIVYSLKNFQLMPLNSVLKLLNKLKVISRKDGTCDLETKKCVTMVREIWNAYENFKHRIERSRRL